MKSQLSWNNKIIEIQIIIRILRVSEHFSKMLEYLIQEFWMIRTTRTKIMCVSITYMVVYSMLLVTGSQSKNAWIWPNSDRWLVVHCAMPSIGQTWVLAPIGAVVEMDVLSTLKRLPINGVYYSMLCRVSDFHIVQTGESFLTLS
jgi:hypothetical protein